MTVGIVTVGIATVIDFDEDGIPVLAFHLIVHAEEPPTP